MDAVISLELKRAADLTDAAELADTGTNTPANDGCVRLLVADADRSRRDLTAANFGADGFDVLTAPSAATAMTSLLATRVAALVVDASLVSGPGTALVAEIRSGAAPLRRLAAGEHLDPDMPIIVTAAERDDLACIRALDAGCDDYVTAPFAYMELRARVGALLRRQTRGSRRARLRVGPLELDAVARQAWVGGQRLRLSSTEFALLHTLATEPTRMFTREEILLLIWGWSRETVPRASTRTLDSHVSRLRRKLRAVGLGYIVNVWGQGYKLVNATSLEQATEVAEVAELVPIAHAA